MTRRRRWLLAVLAVVLVLGAALWSAAHTTLAGGGESPPPIDSEALIGACWAISEQKRASGITNEMRAGAAASIECLERAVLQQAQALFNPDALAALKLEGKLDQINEAYGGYYWSLYNENRECPCGTMYQVFHLSALAGLVEQMIRDTVRQPNEYGFRGTTG